MAKTAQICSAQILVTTGRIVLKFGDIVDMDVKLCKQGFKIQNVGL